MTTELNLGVPAVVVMLVLFTGLILWLSSRYERRIAAVHQELAAVTQRSSSQTELDRDFLTAFLREFPHLTRELHSEVKTRAVPEILNRIVKRCFEPWQSLVLVRGREKASDAGSERRLVVAATARQDSSIRLGMEVSFGRGELGYVAENQRVMSRGDFEAMPPHERASLKRGPLRGFNADLVAPLCFRNETLGVIALSRPNSLSETAKAALQVISHMGGLALHNASTFQEVQKTAQLDGLTRIFNKSYVSHALSKQIWEAEQKGSVVSALLMDLDNFKNYNDTNGHDAGDNLLREFPPLVADTIRETDILGRFGGEEFLVIFPDTKRDQALQAAENIRARIADHVFPHGEKQPLGIVSVSGGVAEFPSDARDSTGLIRAADKALYRAKSFGRNRILSAEHYHIGEDKDVEGNPQLLEAILQRELSQETPRAKPIFGASGMARLMPGTEPLKIARKKGPQRVGSAAGASQSTQRMRSD